jgi:hypothetical protein
LGVREVYRKFFDEPPQAAQAVEDAKAWADGTLALWEQPAFQKLLDKIHGLADKPVTIGSDLSTLAGQIGRQNGIKEVIGLIHSDLAAARRVADATGAGKAQ